MVSGHTAQIRFSFTSKVAMSDTTVEMFTINPATFGATSFGFSRIITHFSDAGNFILALSLTAAGVLSVVDIMIRGSSDTSIAARSMGNCTVVVPLQGSFLVDSWCNKFYWKRTS